MANYYANVRTNYFRVTDEEKYQKLFNRLGSEYQIEDFSEVKDGVMYHGFGAYGTIDFYDENDLEIDFDIFLKEMQEILPDNEAFIYFETGNEKLKYLVGSCIIVTNKEIVSENIDDWAIKKSKELLGDDFVTQINY